MSSSAADRLLALSTLHILSSTTTFNAVRPTPLATLAHVAGRYIEMLAESAKRTAEQAGRPSCTGWDIVGVLEAMDGPGAVEGLHGWCRENAKKRKAGDEESGAPDGVADGDPTSLTDEPSRLAEVAQVLQRTPAFAGKHASGRSPLPTARTSSNAPTPTPTAVLSFMRLSEEEIAALDRAGESDQDEADGMQGLSPLAKPAPPSDSDSDDSDSEDSDASASPVPQPLQAEARRRSSGSVKMAAAAAEVEDDSLYDGWRSKEDVPSHVPPFLPPFPGLERTSDILGRPAFKRDSATAALDDEAEVLESRVPVPSAPADGASLDPYREAVPYAASLMQELHSSIGLPRLPSASPPPFGMDLDDPKSGASTPSLKRRRRDPPPGSLEGFNETFSALTGPRGPRPAYLSQLKARREVASSIVTEGTSDSLSGSVVLPAPFRCSRRVAGWLPYPSTVIPEMKPFASILPDSVTQPVPGDPSPYPTPYYVPAGSRNPAIIPHLVRVLSVSKALDESGFPGVLGRLVRTGPPAPLGEQGEALPYVIEPPRNPAALENGDPRYLEWGFEWQSVSPQDGLPPARSEQPPFKVPPMPPMPKVKDRARDSTAPGPASAGASGGQGLVLRLGGAGT